MPSVAAAAELRGHYDNGGKNDPGGGGAGVRGVKDYADEVE